MQNKLRWLLLVLVSMAGIQAALAQPTLNIGPAGRQTVLTWTTTDTNYILQSNTNLNSASWVTITNIVTLAASNTFTAKITNTISTRFFRLYNPNIVIITDDTVTIPAGMFTMGDTLDGESDAMPTNVNVSVFQMDTNLVTYSQWQAVYNWATNHGYTFDNTGSGRATNHPVQTVDWYDAVKWCNARSEIAGLTPAYYTNAAQTAVYRIGKIDLTNSWVKWTAGYRLPTEAEWEKAARGGLSGQRFPWGNTISHSQANYYGATNYYSYDLGPNGYNAAFTNQIASYTNATALYTSPVGSFAPNGYGLYDMAGNVSEWCWDWYGAPYSGGTDPRGPAIGSERVLRGGVWTDYAYYARCADHNYNSSPSGAYNIIGFRCVRGN